MKTLNLFFAIVLSAVFGFSAQAQTTQKSAAKAKTETIKVSGNCDMCKARIEKAAKSEGVSSASWDSKTKLLTVSYDPSKTSTDAVAKKVAAVGHDAGKYKADDKVYEALPGCCHYERK